MRNSQANNPHGKRQQCTEKLINFIFLDTIFWATSNEKTKSSFRFRRNYATGTRCDTTYDIFIKAVSTHKRVKNIYFNAIWNSIVFTFSLLNNLGLKWITFTTYKMSSYNTVIFGIIIFFYYRHCWHCIYSEPLCRKYNL